MGTVKKYCSSHNYRYIRYDDGHEHLSCNRCGTVFFDSRNQLTYEERRNLISSLFGAIVGLPILWAFIWLLWIAFG